MSRRVLRILSLLFVVAFVASIGGQAGAGSKKAPPGDPPGNNGTVKIERDGPDNPNKANEPHVDGCILWLKYYGFDQNQTADITFTSQAPSTPAGKVLLADTSVKISDTPAGGGQDEDYVIGYNLTSAVQGLKANPQQGYHIKLSSDSKEAPGGAKHKVFWIKCAPAAPTALRVIKAIEGDGKGPFTFEVQCNHRPLDATFPLNGGDFHDVTGIPPGTTCAVIETGTNNAQIRVEEKPATGPPNDGVVTLAAGTPANVYVTNVFPGQGGTPAPSDSELRPPAGTPQQSGGTSGTAGTTGGTGTNAGGTGTGPEAGTSVLGEAETAPEKAATLPRTGNDPRPLTATGLSALAAGLALLAGGRRRRA